MMVTGVFTKDIEYMYIFTLRRIERKLLISVSALPGWVGASTTGEAGSESTVRRELA